MTVIDTYKSNRDTYEFFQGKIKWARLERVNDWGKWTCVLYPNAKSLERLRELQAEGVKNVIKKDDDGYFTTFSRPNTKLLKGKIIAFEPVKVVWKITPENPQGEPYVGIIGNGSDCTLKVEVYTHGTPGGGKAKAARLFSIRIDTLVPFNPDTQFSQADKVAVEGLSNQPEQLF